MRVDQRVMVEIGTHLIGYTANQFYQIEDLLLERELPALKPLDIQQGAHHRIQPVSLLHNNRERASQPLRRLLAPAQPPLDQLSLAGERGQRRLELVSGDREELVANLDGLLSFLVEPGVVQCDSGAASELCGQ